MQKVLVGNKRKDNYRIFTILENPKHGVKMTRNNDIIEIVTPAGRLIIDMVGNELSIFSNDFEFTIDA